MRLIEQTEYRTEQSNVAKSSNAEIGLAIVVGQDLFDVTLRVSENRGPSARLLGFKLAAKTLGAVKDSGVQVRETDGGRRGSYLVLGHYSDRYYFGAVEEGVKHILDCLRKFSS